MSYTQKYENIMREIVLDTETTGLDPRSGHRIIEIGAVEIVDKIITGKQFHTYVNPKRNVPQESYRIHGISANFLQNKPVFENIAAEFVKFIGNSTLVIHNAQFDIKFLNHEFTLIGYPSLPLSNAIDTLKIARQKFPGHKVNLDALCKRYKVDLSSRDFHGALKDAELLAKVYLNLVYSDEQFSFQISPSSFPSIKIENEHTTKYKVVYPTELEKEQHIEFLRKIHCLKI